MRDKVGFIILSDPEEESGDTQGGHDEVVVDLLEVMADLLAWLEGQL